MKTLLPCSCLPHIYAGVQKATRGTKFTPKYRQTDIAKQAVMRGGRCGKITKFLKLRWATGDFVYTCRHALFNARYE